MDEIKIAELREQANALQDHLKQLSQEQTEAVKAFAQTLTDEPIYVRHAYYNWGFEISMLDPTNGYGRFATEITVCYEDHYGSREEKKLTFNTGTSGSFEPTNKEQVFKYKLMAALLDHAPELEEMAKKFYSLYEPIQDQHRKLRWEISKWEGEKKQAERDAKRAEVLNACDPGAWFADAEGKSAYLVVKKTAKMVFFKFYRLRESWNFDGTKVWRNETGYKNEALPHNGFADVLINNGWQLAERPESVKLPK